MWMSCSFFLLFTRVGSGAQRFPTLLTSGNSYSTLCCSYCPCRYAGREKLLGNPMQRTFALWKGDDLTGCAGLVAQRAAHTAQTIERFDLPISLYCRNTL